jgi:C-terminal binding protein
LRKTHDLAAHVNVTKDWNTRLASQLHARRLRGKVLGLIGFGKIGKATALRAKGFGLDVLFYDPLVEDGIDKALGVKRAPTLRELISDSDIISIHCWLDDSTKHIINEESLSWVKASGAWLVNTARGAVVDENALVAALRSNRLLGAAIDVVEVEPYPKSGVLFQNVPNLYLTPHTAFYSDEGFVEMRTKGSFIFIPFVISTSC